MTMTSQNERAKPRLETGRCLTASDEDPGAGLAIGHFVKATASNREAIVREAARILTSGGVIIMPTDTVYGLACHPDFPDALRRIYEIKARDGRKPVAFLASDPAQPVAFGASFSPSAVRFAEKFWPGALTIVADCRGTTEGFRVPDSALARDIITACGGLLRVTSANLSGQPAAVTAQDQSVADIADLCDLVIDDGPSPVGIASTVIRDAPDGWKILRAGGVSEADLGGVPS